MFISALSLHSHPLEFVLYVIAQFSNNTVFAKIANEFFLSLLQWQHLVGPTFLLNHSLTSMTTHLGIFPHWLFFCLPGRQSPLLLLLCNVWIFLLILTPTLCLSTYLGDLIQAQDFYSLYTSIPNFMSLSQNSSQSLDP